MAYRHRTFVVVSCLALITACDRTGDVGPVGSPVPIAVICGDAPRLQQRALEARRQHAETTSDQARIISGSRTMFYMSLATIADLECTVASVDADAALRQALEIARQAEETRSFYESAIQWTQAGISASDAVSLLLEQLHR